MRRSYIPLETNGPYSFTILRGARIEQCERIFLKFLPAQVAIVAYK